MVKKVQQKSGHFSVNRSSGVITVPADLVKDTSFPLTNKKRVMIRIVPEKRALLIYTLPDMEHVNVLNDHASIMDNTLDKEVDVYLDPLFCDYCKRDNCSHVTYALSLPEVQEAYKRKGMKPPEK